MWDTVCEATAADDEMGALFTQVIGDERENLYVFQCFELDAQVLTCAITIARGPTVKGAVCAVEDGDMYSGIVARRIGARLTLFVVEGEACDAAKRTFTRVFGCRGSIDCVGGRCIGARTWNGAVIGGIRIVTRW